MKQITRTRCARGLIFLGLLSIAACEGGEGGSGGSGGSGNDACGNGTIDTGEDCDLDSLAGETCYSQGFGVGILACGGSCTFDTSDCGPATVCEDNIVGLGELCDGTDLNGGACTSHGFISGTIVCNGDCGGFTTTACIGGAVCGDNVAMPPERCDGTDIGAWGCTSLGFSGGTLGCLEDCSNFDTAECTAPPPECGDDLAVGLELCDGPDVRGRDCVILGWEDGVLVCNATCDDYDTSGCTGVGPTCGNTIAEGLEDCDGADLGEDTCIFEGYTGGELACHGDCSFDYSRCTTGAVCGDSQITAAEDCDGNDLGGQSCETIGWDDGMLLCNAGCVFNTVACIGCGDGSVSALEDCEGADLAGGTCDGQGFVDGGTLACDDDCTYDYGDCNGEPICGDGIVAGPETCDGANLGGIVCTEIGFTGGVAGCSDCQIDLSGCTGMTADCGDGVAALHLCDGDDFRDGFPVECASYSLGDGSLTCDTDCTPDVSDCTGGSDICQAIGWYGDGLCDPCAAFGGSMDSDCATVCGADGICGQWYLSAISTCAWAGYPSDPDCGTCGNSTLEVGELCDGAEFIDTADDGTADDQCADWGNYTSGAVTCGINCVPVFSACVP